MFGIEKDDEVKQAIKLIRRSKIKMFRILEYMRTELPGEGMHDLRRFINGARKNFLNETMNMDYWTREIFAGLPRTYFRR